MWCHHALPQVVLVVHSVAILVRLARRQSVAVLPEHITASALRFKRRSLPSQLNIAVVVEAKLLKHTRLAQCLADFRMVLDPVVAPLLRVVGSAPAVRVQVVHAEVNVRVRARGVEITTLRELVRVRAVTVESKAFFAGGNHVLAVKRLDVSSRGLNPVGQDAQVAALATRLVGKLPGEDRGRRAVASDHSLDVGLVLSLSLLVDVPLRVGADASEVEIGCHTAIVGPVVHKVDDQLDAVLLGALDHVVEALQAVSTSIDLRLAIDE